jgi:hypothetical protein
MTNANGASLASFPLMRLGRVDAALAHRERLVTYDHEGNASVRLDAFGSGALAAVARVPPRRQFPAIRATFDDLNKALSRLANSPLVEGGHTLREIYEAELERYEAWVADANAAGAWEPDYGTYVWDPIAENLYLVAPEFWHRLALVTSNAKLVADPERRLGWREIRQRLEGAVVGFAGLSVGGNLLEGWLREARPRQVKVADPDWIEVTNLNRGERLSLRHAVASRSTRSEPRCPYDVMRLSKAECIAYEQALVDPYVTFHVYSDGITRANVDRFVAGNGDEPKLDVLVEEMDDMELKLHIRKVARRHRVDVLMLSDFGNRAHLVWNPFRDHPNAPLGAGGHDPELENALAAVKAGERAKLFDFIRLLCGPDYAGEAFDAFVWGREEQPTGSLPQSGATAMASGAIGGKELALRILGRPIGRTEWVYYDLEERVARHG